MFLVAPSFQLGRQIGEPFLKGKKLYIKVELPNGSLREVRVYDEKEYQRAFPQATPVKKETTLESLKIARGFSEGNIKLVSTNDKDWLSRNPECWFGTDVGWYIASTRSIPANPPVDLKIKELSWEDFLSKFR